MSLSHPLPRELTRPVHVGGVQIGGGAPVVVQSMTCTDTADAQATLAQVCALAQAGCDIARVSVPTEAALEGFRTICAESPVPIVADIHFNHKLAIGAVEAGAAKLRINPGNIGDWAKVDAVIDAAGAAGCAIRIGVNAGSLEQDIAEREDLTQPEKLVMSSPSVSSSILKTAALPTSCFRLRPIACKRRSIPIEPCRVRFPTFRFTWA